ncbi:MAG: hypothetical protein JXR78_15420 [Victivallales bacterium]|nr:hypothetical protein [Victivallales bacterium]
MSNSKTIRNAFAAGEGIFRLAPNWVPRSFCIPGRRIKLHPDDYYALGGERGGIDERWLASTTPADNGPLTAEHEGLSKIVCENNELVLLQDAVSELKDELLGSRIWNQYGCWPVYSKFFDNLGPLPHHIHHRDDHAALVNQRGKPECYYFPPQLNNHEGRFPYTFFGIEPGTSKEQVKQCLKDFVKGDNKITNLSRAYRLEPGTGWDVPPGMLHAPGSLCTYEPQVASDVYAMYQSLVDNQIVPEALLWKDCPPDKKGDFDYLMEVIDWELNVDPHLMENRFMRPRPVKPEAEMLEAGYLEQWICYKSTAVSASELTILPGRTAIIKDSAAYGMIMMQGHGKMGVWDVETPALIRYGQLTMDEFFISEEAARKGVSITNASAHDPLVMLKHFGPANPALTI